MASFPGPLLNKLTTLTLLHTVSTGKRHLIIEALHKKYGVFVRTGPNTLSINSLEAVGPIYSSAQCFNRSEGYRPGRFGDNSLFFIRDRQRHNIRRRELMRNGDPEGIIAGAQKAMMQFEISFLLGYHDEEQKEALRDEDLNMDAVFAIEAGLARVVPKDGVVLVNRYIPGGTIVSVPAYAQEVSPENFWPAPLEFRPERWLEGGLGPDSILRPGALICFSFGPFGCLGRQLAMRELHLAVAQLVLSYDITLAPAFNEELFMDGVRNIKTTLFKFPLLVQATVRKTI
ncbi:hypothetical protein EW026_g1718 [Hermanssonia centrifuga]|uniref:Cytochrome P450 n=1 Tax=Hermanssonia centrifuga TaxID=98765 RepID=A0A4S4KRB2_9APHY|nr:hypothetical protein EW026_g1718 [Hermanssonia centrifuga]